MKNLGCFRDIPISFAGHLDLRSSIGEVGVENFRVVLNMGINDNGQRCRLGGWKKLLSDSIYGFENQDLHDQLLCDKTYYEEFSQMFVGGGIPTGAFNYPYFAPPYTLQGDRITEGQGWQCGYAPDRYSEYTIDGTVENGCYVYSSKIGYPYFLTQGGTSNIAYNNQAWGTAGGGGFINWDRPHINQGNDYLDAFEAVNGPSAAVNDARTFLDALFLATDKTTDTQGYFTGTTGVIEWQYWFEFDAELSMWWTAYWFEGAAGSGAVGYDVCSSGPPSYYSGSYFYLACNSTASGDYPGYNYGPASPIISTQFAYEQAYCGDYLYTRRGCREAITLLSEFVNDSGIRKLIAGTQSSIYQLNERTGNWRIIADGFGGLRNSLMPDCSTKEKCGCGDRRFSSAALGNYMLFVNNFDPVQSYQFDDPAEGCELRSVHPVPDLAALGIESARTVAAWKGFMFLGGVIENGRIRANRVHWSDFNAPLIWVPEVNNEASFQDLGFGEEILCIQPIGDFLFFYTTSGIWQCTLVEASQGRFRFRQIYKGPDVPRYQYSMVNTGEANIYLGENGIFVWTLLDSEPKRIEWMHKASGVIFNGLSNDFIQGYPHMFPFGSINTSRCNQAVGGYDEMEKQVWFSWPSDNFDCPTVGLILNLRYAAASIVDHGFTAFGNFRSDTRPNIRDFLREYEACHLNEFGVLVKEGTPYDADDEPFGDPPLYLFNPTENPDLPMHPDSLCAKFGDLRIQDICQGCDSGPIFVMASSEDYALKQYSKATYYRERFNDEQDPGICAFAVAPDGETYCADGYASLIQGDMNDFGQDEDKYINGILVDFEAVAQTTPNMLKCQVAYGEQPKCATWVDLNDEELRCLSDSSAAEHDANNTRPGRPANFKSYRRGRYIGWRLWVDVPVGDVSTNLRITGGGSCFSRLVQSVRRAAGKWLLNG